MKKTKIIVPALGMLLLSTAASVTGTVAWFAANQTVSATGMTVQAKAEAGIVMTNEAAEPVWGTNVTASHGATAALVPTSTATCAADAWYHATSSNLNSADAGQAVGNYTALETEVNSDGVGQADGESYYFLNTFYIKSSATAIAAQDLYVKKVESAAGSNSANLDASLRVAIKMTLGEASAVKIFAPISTTSLTYTVGGTASVTAVDASAGKALTTNVLENISIPTNTSTQAQSVKVDVFIYFEGEDVNCKSANIPQTTLDSLAVSVDFGVKGHA